jgi:tetrahydromethanopterin S-methyltransferase subunit E
MNKTLPLLMIIIGVTCGMAIGSNGEDLRYAIPLLVAIMFATLTRLNRLDP